MMLKKNAYEKENCLLSSVGGILLHVHHGQSHSLYIGEMSKFDVE